MTKQKRRTKLDQTFDEDYVWKISEEDEKDTLRSLGFGVESKQRFQQRESFDSWGFNKFDE